MEFLQRLFLYISAAGFVLLLTGLFKPWIVLWWEDHQNRKKVFKFYGSVAAITYALYWVIELL